MKRKKLLKKLADYLDLDRRVLDKKREKLKEVLSELREKERKLKHKIETEQDETAKQRLERDLTILRAQRRKGIFALRGGDLSNNSD